MSVGHRDDERRIEPVFGPVAFIKTGFLFALYRCGCCSLCVHAFVCVLISPVLMERGKKEIPLQYLKIPTGAHYCLTLPLLSPQLRIYAFRHTEPETKIELNRRKKVWRRGRKGQRRERRMCLRSQAGVRWKTLLNYITVAFQHWPA